jgi:hypothetical protein
LTRERALIALITDVRELEASAERVSEQVYALAKRHDIEVPL